MNCGIVAEYTATRIHTVIKKSQNKYARWSAINNVFKISQFINVLRHCLTCLTFNPWIVDTKGLPWYDHC